MTALVADFFRLLRWDFKLQLRYYFWFVALAISAMWSLLLLVPGDDLAATWIPVLIFGDLSTIGLLFIGGMLYLERRQGTLYVSAIMPVPPGTWLTLKLLSLSLLCLACAVLIALLTSRTSVDWFRLIPATLLCGALFTSIGFMVAVSLDKLMNYFFVMAMALLPLNLPALDYLDIYSSTLMWLLPSQGVMWALAGSFQDMPLTTYLSCLALAGAWTLLAYWYGLRAFRRYVATRPQL